jgi:hypothetical protein
MTVSMCVCSVCVLCVVFAVCAVFCVLCLLCVLCQSVHACDVHARSVCAVRVRRICRCEEFMFDGVHVDTTGPGGKLSTGWNITAVSGTAADVTPPVHFNE